MNFAVRLTTPLAVVAFGSNRHGACFKNATSSARLLPPVLHDRDLAQLIDAFASGAAVVHWNLKRVAAVGIAPVSLGCVNRDDDVAGTTERTTSAIVNRTGRRVRD